MMEERFWTLGRISLALQVMLVVLVIVVLAVSMNTLVSQTSEFGKQANDRAQSAEAAVERAEDSIRRLTCILLIAPEDRTPALVVEECNGIIP